MPHTWNPGRAREDMRELWFRLRQLRNDVESHLERRKEMRVSVRVCIFDGSELGNIVAIVETI